MRSGTRHDVTCDEKEGKLLVGEVPSMALTVDSGKPRQGDHIEGQAKAGASQTGTCACTGQAA